MIKHSSVQGYGLLALQAHLPSLHPAPCNIEADLSNCKEVHGWNATLLYGALYINAFGDGFVRSCMPSLGADQFDHKDPSESRQKSSFFNWYTFGISLGGFYRANFHSVARELQGMGHRTWGVCYPDSVRTAHCCCWSAFLPQPSARRVSSNSDTAGSALSYLKVYNLRYMNVLNKCFLNT
jgi:dipeptide/tripeptide permease